MRLNGELDRTAFQQPRFADLAQNGAPFAQLDEPLGPGPPPGGHPAMVRTLVPLVPVAMFSASNFPFAFSVLVDDTASALAAGCPVLVKAHSAHLQLSARAHALAQRVLNNLGLPSGLIGMVQGAGGEVGVQLIRHPAIAAGAFTGSTRGGAALQAQANARPRPIPFYGELGSINPVVALPGILATRGAELAQTLAASIGAGTGQFCTSPGLIVLIDDPASTAFVDERQRQGNCHFLAHALGKSRGAAIVRRRVQSSRQQRLFDHSGIALVSCQAEQVGDVLARAQVFVDRHIFRDIRQLPARLVRRGHRIDAVHAHAAGDRLQEAEEQAEGSGLARAIGAKQGVDFAGMDRKVQANEDGAPCVSCRDGARFEAWRHRRAGLLLNMHERLLSI